MTPGTATMRERSSSAFAGSIAGLAGGLAMAACLVSAAVVEGIEPFAPLEPMGATFGEAVEPGGAGSLLLGVLLHLAVSATVGLLFATVLPPDFPPGNAAFLCVGFALTVMGFMTSCVVPAANPLLEESFHGLGGSWVIAHALFGLTAGYLCQRLRRPRVAGAGRERQVA
jgi:hypothetical protein